MKVKDLMITKVVNVLPDTPISEVADILHKFHFTGVPVVDERGILLGVIMERDFITAESKIYLPTYIKMLQEIPLASSDKKFVSQEALEVIKLKAKDVMNTNIVVASPETTVEDVSEMFATKRVNPIPVVNEKHKVVGVISRSDLISLFVKHEVKEDREHIERVVDIKAGNVYKEMREKFTLVARSRVSIWWAIALGFLAVGIVLGQALLIKFS